ncbi:hypothetical protein [Amorphus sp. MBR-141]
MHMIYLIEIRSLLKVLQAADMPFSRLMRDKVKITSKNGNILAENLPASVQSGKIFTMDSSVPISVGDHFLRELPSGLVEDYEVIDPGYHPGGSGIPDNYQSKVRRTDQPPSTPSTVINNISQTFSGENSRGYVQSTDNARNTSA